MISIDINNRTMHLSDRRIEHLAALLISPNREWASALTNTARSTFDLQVSGHPTTIGFLEGFSMHDFEMIRNAFLLEEVDYRMEIQEYGKAISNENPRSLTKREDQIGKWLFSSLSLEEIAYELFCSKDTVEFHQESIAKKMLIKGIERSRFHVCAALLAHGYLREFKGIPIDFVKYESFLSEDQSA